MLSSTLLSSQPLAEPALVPSTLAAQIAVESATDKIVDRLGAYLLDYERQIANVIAEENMWQEVYPFTNRRVLRSEVMFSRLPGEANWLGYRLVTMVNGLAMRRGRVSLPEMLLATRNDPASQIAVLLKESSRYNLGLHRTINMPSLPLELLHPQHRHRFRVSAAGADRWRGRTLERLVFKETGAASIVRFDGKGRGDVRSEVKAWVAPASGALWQAEVRMFVGKSVVPTGVVRVLFETNRGLGHLVPKEMQEQFPAVRLYGRGAALYSKFRRFETTARIVTPPAQ